MKSCTARLPRSNASGETTGSSAPRIASDQARSGSRSSFGTPEQVADDLDRDRRGEVLDQVDVAGLGHPVEQPLDERLEAGLHLGDRLRRQRTDDQPAHPRVQRRIVEHQARRVVLVEQRVAVLRLVFGLLVGAEQRRVLVDVLAVGIAASAGTLPSGRRLTGSRSRSAR
jgi:hypothetical protein